MSPHRTLPRGTRHGGRGRRRAVVPHTAADPVVVTRAAAGDRTVVPCAAELDLAIDLLDTWGHSARSAAERLGVSTRTITRRRAARRQETP